MSRIIKNILILFFLTLSACTTKRYNLSTYPIYKEIPISQNKRSVFATVKDDRDRTIYAWNDLKKWENNWIEYTNDNSFSRANFKLVNCNTNENDVTFFWFITLGIIPGYTNEECSIIMEIEENEVKKTSQIGIINKNTYLGWFVFLIPQKTIKETFIDNKEDISKHILTNLRTSKISVKTNTSKKTVENKEVDEKIEKELDTEINQMLNDLKK